MKTRDFFFELPEELIAQKPPEKRGTSRLLLMHRSTGNLEHLSLPDLIDRIPPETTIVFNDSRVRKARIQATAHNTGGRVEFLFLEKLEGTRWKVMTSKARKQIPGKTYDFPGEVSGKIVEICGSLRVAEFSTDLNEEYFNTHGHVPLPPYIKRPDNAGDSNRYQTVYSRETGSAAAPTAGLHFTPEILASLQQKGCNLVYITLHVGLGTFLPIRSETIEEHRMHEEVYTISPEAAATINRAKELGHPVLAVGTTVVRTLESAGNAGKVQPGTHSTDKFIYPGYNFSIVDHLMTNFHTPGSSLLVLVSAFAGKARIDTAYRAAVAEKYRFFSYGDAMLIL